MRHRSLAATALILSIATVTAADPIRAAGCKTEHYLIKALADACAPGITVELGKTGNKKAMMLLAAGSLDLAYTCQPAARLCAGAGIDAAKAAELKTVTIAKDPIVLVANPDAKVTGLTLAQVRDIVSGKVGNWSAVGGADLPIRLAWLDPSVESGVVVVFQELTTGETPLVKPSRTLSTPEALGHYAASESGALVILGLNSIKPAYGTLLAIDTVTPERASVTTGTYPLTVTYHLVHARSAAATVKPFLDFVLSQKGKTIIDQHMVAMNTP